MLRIIARSLLGLFLLFTGTAHLTFAREAFVAQVPAWLPLPVDLVVVASGIVELGLGLALLFGEPRRFFVVAQGGLEIPEYPRCIGQAHPGG